jgi:hypothetical protein
MGSGWVDWAAGAIRNDRRQSEPLKVVKKEIREIKIVVAVIAACLG